jgi:hypothetical protein
MTRIKPLDLPCKSEPRFSCALYRAKYAAKPVVLILLAPHIRKVPAQLVCHSRPSPDYGLSRVTPGKYSSLAAVALVTKEHWSCMEELDSWAVVYVVRSLSADAAA